MNLDALKDMFLKERRHFAARFPHVATTALKLKRFRRNHDRDCCMANVDGPDPTIFFHTDVVEGLTLAQYTALVRHELAHVADPDLTEAGTDSLAEDVTQHCIYYGPDDIQTLDPRGGRRPRPKHLPK